jgi:hypothetical protein
MPFSLLENYNGSNSTKLTRLVRLPRLYRLMRIIRMLKMLKFVGKSEAFNKWLELLNVSVGMSRLIKTLAI